MQSPRYPSLYQILGRVVEPGPRGRLQEGDLVGGIVAETSS